MLIISFAWTTDALLAGVKTCTRRNWAPEYARRFYKGLKCQGYNRSPRYRGQPIGIIQLTRDPYRQYTSAMTEQDYADEGLLWMERQGLTIRGLHPRDFFESWKAADERLYVVRFQLLKKLLPESAKTP